MAEKKNTNKILSITLIITICIAFLVLIMVNLPESDEQLLDDELEDIDVVLTIIYENTYKNYTLEELELFSATTGYARNIKGGLLPEVRINPDVNEPAWEFTGVVVNLLLEEFEDLPNEYYINVSSSDNWVSTYTKDHVMGSVEIYNETGNITANSGAIMILAYMQNGEYISEQDGPLRIVFVNSNAITNSRLWAKLVVSIEIMDI
jgi:hypothetical protein